MTDNEIIKAIECCAMNKCDKCSIKYECRGNKIRATVIIAAFDLINRQKERIEELEKSELSKAMTFNSDTIKRCSAEAIREFSKYLIDKAETNIINISDLPDLVAEFMKTEDK